MEGFLAYFAFVTLLFFFWVYGIVAFVRDLRGTYLPAIREWRASRRGSGEAESGRDRDEAERGLL